MSNITFLYVLPHKRLEVGEGLFIYFLHFTKNFAVFSSKNGDKMLLRTALHASTTQTFMSAVARGQIHENLLKK